MTDPRAGGGQGHPRLPLADRLLLALVRGLGSDFVVGDVEERYREELAGGMALGAARRRLRRQTVKTVGWWGITWRRRSARGKGTRTGGDGMATWTKDVVVALRGLARRPGFALAVVATLGLGIGATGTIYSVVDTVLLRPLPFAEGGRTVLVGNTFPRRVWDDQAADLQHLAGVSVLNWMEYRQRIRAFQALEALEPSNLLLSDVGDGPELASAARVSEGVFRLLGVTPALGRTFLPEEHRSGGPDVVLVSHGTWLRRFGGDPEVVGRPMDGGSGPVVVGVLPRGFRPPEVVFSTSPDFLMPLQPDHARYADRGRRSLYLVGRLAPGVELATARDEAQAVAEAVSEDFPDGNVYEDGEFLGVGANELKNATVGASRRLLVLFLAASGMLLLIAALNAATLLLARTLERSRELGVRAALGAGGGTLIRLVLTEGVLLGVAGGVVGAGLAYGGVALVHRFGPSSIPRLAEIAVDGRILGVTTLVAVATGVAVGLVPALRVGRTPPGTYLQGGTGGTASRGGLRLRGALVVAQVTVAVVLLSGAGLLLNSFAHLRAVDPGFDPQGLLTLRMDTKRPGAEPAPAWQDWETVVAHVAAVPGVVAAAGTSNPPFQDPFWAPWVRLPGEGAEVRESNAGYAVTPGYFDVVGTRLVQGRAFSAADGPDGPFVAIVNEAWVRQRLGGGEVLGQVLRFTDTDERQVTVVGVVEDVIQGRAQEGSLPAVYVPHTQADWPFVQVVARLALPASVVVPEVRKALTVFSPYVPPRDVRTMDERIGATRTDPRFQTLLLGSFASLALLLASAGLYGSLSHAVARRRRELGIRTALGAPRKGLLAMVVGQGVRLAGVGLVLGLAGALALSRVLESLLFGITPRDPATYVTVSAVLGVVAALASLVPARRATGVDPVEVLKSE